MPDDADNDMQDLSPAELARFVYCNGLNGATGGILAPNIERSKLGERVRGRPKKSVSGDPAQLTELKDRAAPPRALLDVEAEDPEDLAEAGWGVIFAADDPQAAAILDALSPLLTRRRQEAGGPPHYQEYTAERGFRQGETAHKFLERYGVGPGPAIPGMVPYYLLIVGDPARIPFDFQQGLDVQYAVGRLHFATPAEYRQYAESVVEAEDGKFARPRRAAFFGVRNPGDGATQLSAQELVAPLAQQLDERLQTKNLGWSVDLIPVAEAKKPRLAKLMGGADTPALLFTASHGALFRPAMPDGPQSWGPSSAASG